MTLLDTLTLKRKRALRKWAVTTRHPVPKGFAISTARGNAYRTLISAFSVAHKLPAVDHWYADNLTFLEDWYPKPSNAQKLQSAVNIWYAKRDQTHYSYPAHNMQRMQTPPLPGVATWTDCSGMIRCMWKQLGWPDPAGQNYAVWGSSESFIQRAYNYGKFITPGNERLGDIACYRGGVGHAELVVAKGQVLTNGNELGPYYRGLGLHSGKMYIVRLAPFV
jgi:hypothetical protein